MSRFFLRLLLPAFLFCATAFQSRATHLYGADIGYVSLGGNSYKVVFTVYGDCSGSAFPYLATATPNIEIYDGGSLYQTVTTFLDTPGFEITPVCPVDVNNTVCTNPSSLLPGVKEYRYSTTLTLPYTSANWLFRFNGDLVSSAAGRSNNITNITSGTIMALEATLNNTGTINNSSVFTTSPTPFYCINIPANYNPGSVDVDGDALSYSMVAGLQQSPPGGTVSYVGGYTAAAPLATAAGAYLFNAATGQIQFTPNAAQKALVVQKVTETNGSGTIVGTTMREMTFVVLSNCSNNAPGGVITNPSTGQVDTSATVLQVCASVGTLTFNINPTDVDTDSIAVSYSGLPAGSALTVIGDSTAAPIGVFSWPLGGVSNGSYTFYVTFSDNGCPLSSVQTVAYTIIVGGQLVHAGPDTFICVGDQVQLNAVGDPAAAYTWTPAAGLSNSAIANPVAAPTTTTTYIVSSLSTGLGCLPSYDTVTVAVAQHAIVNAGPDLVTCLGTPVQLNAIVQPVTQPYTYLWTPAAGNGLSNPGVPNPVFTPVAGDVGTIKTLTLMADPGAAGCEGSDQINIRVLPNDFTLSNHDTTICFGASVQINATGDTAFSYLWAPTAGVTPPNIINPLITPTETTTYTVTASYPTCPDIVKDLTISVEPSPTVNIGPDLSKCQWDTLQLHAFVTPAGYPLYTYTWSPDSNLDMGNVTDVVFSGQASATLTFSVRTPAGCSAQDQIDITVHQGNFATLLPGSDVGICPGDSVQLTASGGVFYNWTPGLFLSDSTTANPVSHPFSDVSYNLLVTDQYGCYDTLGINIDLHPGALLELGDTVLLYPGDSVQFNPGGNCLYYTWFPPLGLSNDSISNPVAMPEVDTRYFVTAMTEWGCATSDSVDVRIAYDSELDVPNAFIPGTAGKNSTIAAVHLGLASVKYFQIFDRWGVKVFDTQDINEGWDGSLNGTPQPMGVYVYQVEGYTFRGKKVKKSGNITLVR